MTVALPASAASKRRRIDLSVPLFAGFALFLCVLVILPLFWLVVYALSDAKGSPTLANFVTLFTDPDLIDPLTVTVTISSAVGVICCLVAAPMGFFSSSASLISRIRVLSSTTSGCCSLMKCRQGSCCAQASIAV